MVRICCAWCHGTGQIALTGVYAQTLELIRQVTAAGGEVTGAELARQEGCKGPAMNNRLDRLERLGLVVSRRFGRKRLYRVVEMTQAKE